MNDREEVQRIYGVGEAQEGLWPVFQTTVWSEGPASITFIATFTDHAVADEFCRRWTTEPKLETDEAGFER